MHANILISKYVVTGIMEHYICLSLQGLLDRL